MRRKDREIKNIEDIELIIKKADVCRIALVDGDMPYIVALNFGYKRGEPSVLYFHCAQKGKKLDIIKKNNNVCFQMDIDHVLEEDEDACEYGMKYASIVGFGKIFVIEDESEKIDGLNLIMKQYTGKNDFSFNEAMLSVTSILKLEINEMTGKRKC